MNMTHHYFRDSVRLGEWDYNVTDDCIPNQMNQECADPVKDVKIDQEIPHAFYSPNSKSNDIGLLRLVEPVQFTGKLFLMTSYIFKVIVFILLRLDSCY